jgi:uncharacterized membrane protein YesL
MRLVPANVAWGAGVVLIVTVGLIWPPGALLSLPLLVLPTAVVFRVAANVVRGEPWVGLRDVVRSTRGELPATLGLGVVFLATGAILGTNVLTGLRQADPPGLILATLAGWGMVALWCGTIVAWPLVVDPARAKRPIRDRLRLAGALLLTQPIRFGALGVVVAMIVVISTILTAAILTVSVAFVAVVACRSVYPAADRLEIALRGERS